ncbi:MAG: BspA family leucine-rich repeat surface protein [Mesorhizobium sp.]
MALTNIFGRETVRVSGNATASAGARDFVIQGNPGDVLNYAREGNNLVVRMKNGKVHTIRNFAEHGFDHNHLVFADHGKLSMVDFSNALTTAGDGIIEAAVTMHSIGAGISTTALLGILSATPLSFLKDSPPSLGTPTLHFATDTAINDGLTSDNTLVFAGTADPNTTVEIFLDARSIGTATANSSGTWSFDYSGTILPDGTYAVTAIATDADGNASPSSSVLPITIDTIAPDALTTFAMSSDTGAPHDGISSDNMPSFSGTAEPNAIVEVFIGDISVGTTKADAHGEWVLAQATTILLDGDYVVTATATDAAGNVSALSQQLNITIDTTRPDAPLTLKITSDTGIVDDGITYDDTLSFSGGAEANSIVKLFIGGTSIGSTTAGGDGTWSFDYTGTELAEGGYTLTATATDLAGNVSISSAPLSITIDTTIPFTPEITDIRSNTGSLLDSITSDNTLVFVGIAAENTVVKLFIGVERIGSTTVSALADWGFDYTGTTLPDGTYSVTAKSTDIAGNVSATSTPFLLTVDTSVDQPEILAISNDSGLSQSDGITNDNTLIFTGHAEANGSVELFIDGTSIGTTTVDGLGEWSFDHTGTALANGSYAVTAIATDLAGNVSLVSSEFALTVNAPTVIIDGDGSRGGLVMFTFSEAVDASTFTESDLIIANGFLVPYTFDKIDATTWQANVEPDLGENTTNIAVSIAAGSVQTLDGAFFGAAENVTSLEMLFADISLPSDNITAFDTSHATTAYATFYGNTTFNQDISGWDVSKITTMEEMFNGAGIFNQDISGWNTGKVTSMANMFYDALDFNQSIGTWDVSKVLTMDGMFDGATSFNQNLNDWDTSSLLRAVGMFANASAFNGEIGNWDTSHVTTMIEMFHAATSFNQDIGDWNTGSVLSLSQMFTGATSFNQDIGAWDVSNVQDASYMFFGASAFNQNLDNWDVGSVTNFDGMFYDATAFNGDIGSWDITGASTLKFMFNGASSFNQDIGGWDTSNLTSLYHTFYGASAFNQDLSSWSVGGVTLMTGTFYGATAFDADISGWDTSKVTSMKDMFRDTTSFDQDLGGWDISSLTDASGMFINTGMSVENMDKTLRGWAKLDTAAGETAIQMNVDWYIGLHTDITAFVYLQGKYHWQFSGELDANVKWDSSLTGTMMNYNSSTTAEIIHGLYGDDTIIGGSGDDWIVGGEGNDSLSGGAGRDTFHYGFENAGSDTILDFEMGQNSDIISISDLLIGYNPTTSTLSDFLTTSEDGDGNLVLSIFYKGQGSSTPLGETVTITLGGVGSATSLQDLITDGNLVLV